MNGKLGDLFPVGNYKILATKLINFYENEKDFTDKISESKKIFK